jgi:hypothetical protein
VVFNIFDNQAMSGQVQIIRAERLSTILGNSKFQPSGTTRAKDIKVSRLYTVKLTHLLVPSR